MVYLNRKVKIKKISENLKFTKQKPTTHKPKSAARGQTPTNITDKMATDIVLANCESAGMQNTTRRSP